MRLWTTQQLVAVALLGCLSASCADTAADREPQPSQLDRLRVLAIAADPPDLAPGESATLDALVFEPDAQPVRYAWSWCPVRVDAESGASCPIAESLWGELWTTAGLAGDPPAYDLGSDERALLRPGFEADSAARLCQAVDTLGPAAEPARVACIDGFEANAVLRVRVADEEELAVKRVALLPDVMLAEARNHNPGPIGAVSVHDVGAAEAPVSDGTLRTGRDYRLRAELGEGASEVLPGGTMGEQRETLVLSWFVTPGELTDLDDDEAGFGPFEDDSRRTVYVPGESPLESFLENGWRLPFSDRPTAELVLVLRDGRGGVTWRRDPFLLVSEAP